MNTTPGSLGRELSRRRVLEILGLGAAGATLLSACGGDGGSGGSGGGQGGGGGGVAEFHGAYPYQVPPKGHFNFMSGVTDAILAGTPYQDLILIPGGMWLWAEKKWVPMLAEKWAFDEAAKTFTYTVRQGITWSDGKPVTAKDVVTTFWCRRVMRQVEWQFLENVEATDDYTVVFTMKKPSTVIERYALRQGIFSDATYGEFARRAQELFQQGKDLDSPEGKKLNEELQAYRPKDLENEVITNGPYRWDFNSITNAQLTLVKNEKGYLADTVQFDKIVLYNGEVPTVTPLVLSGEVDYATHGFPVATEKQLIQKGVRIIRPPIYSGPALFFNMDKIPEFRDVRVRRAFAHAINRDDNGTFALGESGVGVKFMAGFSDNQVPDWLSPEDQEKLNKYEYDLEKAAVLLAEAGWRKQGDSWIKPDGKPAAYELIYPAEFADWSAAGENLAKQLTAFGIKVTGRGVTHTQQPIDVDKGAFQLAIQAWGSSSQPHPHFSFVTDLFTHNIPIAANQGGKGMGFELKQQTEAFGEVDLEAVVTAAGEGLDEEIQKKNVTTAAIAFNELLPIVPLFERYGNNPALEGTRVEAWPDDSDPILKNSPYADNFTIMLILDGRLKPAKK
ncbi:ABC transporter substrate-binding protein [Thermasporomyces composti]|jgi:peptide/nickel transport system substrate-binding protein|uniref:Peptide/nickel transport system substrate-binding protein n=1 Tax=Thermasporomyces composti TaxID=696763 RepID=A0A3D9V8Q9_THECX|nr:ABC transporter substrate-binding protein [Thermasporomyces composti]REF38152.1 peptide/nickel transport system substrate-binding protein [Thermasporomyces composti]